VFLGGRWCGESPKTNHDEENVLIAFCFWGGEGREADETAFEG